jgi:hypothetical protein
MLLQHLARLQAAPLAVLVNLLALNWAYAQSASTLEWVSGNSANNQVSELDWGGLQSLLLNTDANSYSSLVSFAFRTNTCNDSVGTEILAADTNRGWLVRYTDADNYAAGAVFCDDATPGCPARPEGLSIAQDGKLAVVSTGQGGTSPSVTILDEAACGGDPLAKPYPYENPRSTGPICLGSNGVCDSYPDRITDSAFVRVPGGGLNPGDLVIVANPGTVAYIPAEDLPLATQASTPSFTVATVLADVELGGDVTSGAFVTGTGGAGALGTDSESEDFLVTVTGGVVKVLRWRKDASGDPQLAQNPPPSLFTGPLGNGPLGITAGVLGDKTYVGLARRNQGTLERCELSVINGRIDGVGSYDIAQCDSIQDAQNPQDIIVNTDVLTAEDCDLDTSDGGQIGCKFSKTVQIAFTQNTFPFQNIAADIRIIEVPCDLQPPVHFDALGLPGDYTIPYHTVPISLGDDQSCIYVYANFEDDVDITAGNWIWSDVLLSELLDELQECRIERFQQVYHPDCGDLPCTSDDEVPFGNAGVLYPIDVVCQNPPGGLKRDNSPSVFGASLFLNRLDDGSRQALRGIDKDTKDESIRRYGALTDIVQSSALSDATKDAILGALAPAETLIKKKKFADASDVVDAAIVYQIYENTEFEASGVRPTLYGDVFGLALNLSYFLWEVGNYPGVYCPPVDLSAVGVSCGTKSPPP